MQNKKIYFILGGCLVVYFVIMFLFLAVPKMKKDREQAVLIFDTNPASFLVYQDGKWENGNLFDDYNWKNFDMYTDSGVRRDYIVQSYKDRWYFYGKDQNPVKFTSLQLGVHSNFLITVLDYKKSTLNSTDLGIIKDVVKKQSITNLGEFEMASKIILDVDSDGVSEELLVVSNYYLTESSNEKTFSLLILRDGNDINILEEKYFSSSYERCTLHFDGFVSINKRNHLIAGCTYFDRIGTKHCMYQVKHGKYERIVSC